MFLKRTTGTPAFVCLLLSLLLILLVTLPVGRLSAAPLADDATEGKAIIQAKCISCHTVGGGDTVGPDLKGVTSKRDRAWLTSFISTPDAVIAKGDPIATELLNKYKVPMPNMALTADDVTDIIAYLEAQDKPASGAKPTQEPAASVGPGEAARGKALFTGTDSFEHGGPPCMACHNVAGIGGLGGGSLGLDLTPAYTKFGDSGIASLLTTLPFPTMKPVFGGRPLTTQEQADLTAFLQEAAQAERSNLSPGILMLIGAGGALVLVGLGNITWRRRRVSGVRRPLVEGKS